jgi:hypothetical protein
MNKLTILNCPANYTMRFIFLLSALLFLSLLTGCSNVTEPQSWNLNSTKDIPGPPSKPPFPKTGSILPLALGNRWVFSYIEYDSAGNIINPDGKPMDLHLSISGGYGIINDTGLVMITEQNFFTTFSTYAYQFEWEEQKKGFLVVSRDLYPLAKRGLYIVGDYLNGKAHLYPSEKLWLAYPAESGKKWQYSLDDSADSSQMHAMELISNKGEVPFPNPHSMTALSFYHCYIYKETIGASVFYYYYKEKMGQIAYLEYVDNKLHATYLLQSFTEEN